LNQQRRLAGKLDVSGGFSPMMFCRFARIAIAAALVVAAAGCSKRRPDMTAPLPIPGSDTIQTRDNRPDGPLSEPQTRAQIPPPQPVPDGASPPLLGPFQPVAEAKAEPVRQARPVAVRPQAQPSPAPAAPEPEPVAVETPSAVPQLGPLLSAAEQREINRLIDAGLHQTRQNLERLAGRDLNANQRASLKRIRAFMRQVDEVRERDLPLARNLADRARVLSEDLARNLR
jgi:hypothetical protein